MSRLRALLAALLVTVVVAACGGSSLRQATSGGNAFGTFLAGISAENMDGEGGYLSWWRGGGGGAWRTPSDWVPVILDARCPLKIATEYYAKSGESLPTGVRPPNAPSPKLFANDVTNYGQSGFYSTARMEALIVLVGPESPAGAALGGGGGSPEQQGYDCSDKNRRQGYLPVRVDLRTGAYIVEGWVNPAATVSVSVETLESSKIKTDASGQWDDTTSGPVYSPLRLNRFRVTPNNLGRVLSFATINKSSGDDTTARRIHWFRVSDLAPYYAELAPGSCPGLGFAYAFYESFDPFKGAPCKPSGDPLPIAARLAQGQEVTQTAVEEEAHPDTLPPPLPPDTVHAIVPVAGPHQGQFVDAEGE
jgi:hypothetical protein